VPMRFDQIENAVLRGEVDCGVLIHEGRFTYQAKGLTLIEDLGHVWDARMKCPLPLAAIAIRRDLVTACGSEMDSALRASVGYALADPDASRDYVARHAQEMDAAVVMQHIKLYVNDYTLALDERAVHVLLDWQQEQGLNPTAPVLRPIFI
jgi:1,4-dihydroxy-6-naphthoate synthase